MSEALLPRGLSKVGSETTRALLPLTVTVIPLCALIVCGLGFWMIVAAPAYIRGVECNVLFTIQKALTGSRLYTNPNELPFDVAQYSPLYYLICQAVSQLFGISPIDAKAIFFVARSVSLGCSLLSFLVLYHLQVRTLLIPHRIAIVATAFAFASCSPWLFLARPDALMYLFLISTIAAIAHIDRTEGTRRFLWLALATLLALGAVAAKQNGAIVIAIVLLSLLASGRGLDFLIVSGIFVSVGAILTVTALSVWPFLLDNVVDGVKNGISFQNAINKTYGRTLSNFAFPLAIGIFVSLKWAKLPPADRTFTQTCVLVAIAVSLAAALTSGLKAGSGESYFNEAIIFSSLAASMFLASPAAEPKDVLLKAMACFLLVFLPFWVGKQWYDYYWLKVDPAISLIEPVNTFDSKSFESVASFVRQEMRGNSQSFVLSWELAMNNNLPEYCIFPQKEVTASMLGKDVLELSAFEKCVGENRLEYGISRSNELPTELFGVPLPPSTLVYENGGLKVFEFSDN